VLVTGVQPLSRAAALDLSTSHLWGDKVIFFIYVFIHIFIYFSFFLIFVVPVDRGAKQHNSLRTRWVLSESFRLAQKR